MVNMLNLQELLDKTRFQGKEIQECLDKGSWHPEDASIFQGLKREDRLEVKDTLDNLSLSELLLRTGALTTGGLQGGNYLIANKVHDTLMMGANQYDIAPLVSREIVSGWKGADLTVAIGLEGTYVATEVGSAGLSPEGGGGVVAATITPKTYKINLPVTNDMLEDNAFGLIEMYTKLAGQACGRKSTSLILYILINAPDGDGNLNTQAASADETTYAQLLAGHALNGNDLFISDTLIITPESWRHSVGATASGLPGITTQALVPTGFAMKLQTMDVIFNTDPLMHDSADLAGAAMTACKTLVFDRKSALLTGRKRWLQIEEFSNWQTDLEHAVISFRQDSVTLYKDSICLITEA